MTDLRGRDENDPEVRSAYWQGEGYDCENCGWNSEYGRFHLWPDGNCCLNTWIGCYSGGYFEGREDVLEELDAWKHLDGWEKFANEVREMLND